jgi:pSer/pThr/pTyr-binding forkhead associated (FHA) protein
MREGERRVLGRSNTCDYLIPDPTVSSRHAELVRSDDGWTIRDLGSLNGTRVNGWLVTEQRLQPGDTLEIGAAVFDFEPQESVART